MHQRVGESLVLNGTEDNLVVVPHHGPSFFADLNTRVAALAGPGVHLIEYRFYPSVDHRPSWVNRDAAAWLNDRLHFPNWRGVSLDSLGETHIGYWATATGARINRGYNTEKTEAGIQALGHGFAAPARNQLQVVPAAEWQAHEDLYTWQGWAKRVLQQEGLPPVVPEPAPPKPAPAQSSPPAASH